MYEIQNKNNFVCGKKFIWCKQNESREENGKIVDWLPYPSPSSILDIVSCLVALEEFNIPPKYNEAVNVKVFLVSYILNIDTYKHLFF